MNAQNALLPSGFEDLLPPDAEGEYGAIGTLMQVFARFGYARVKPPMAEFEESLLGDGPGKALSGETFRVMDPVTHRMMALRSDITAQIARIARSRLEGEARPLRLTYANDVIRTRASQQRTLRQFTQVGCEMIGMDNAASDIEIAVVVLSGLEALELKGASLDFAVPRLVDLIFAAHDLAPEEEEVLRTALKGREVDALLKAGDQKLGACLADLVKAAGPAQPALAMLKKMNLPKEAKALVARLAEVVEGAERAMVEMGLEQTALSIDPVETKGFDYHDGVAFTLYAKGARGEIGRGGRYIIFDGEQDAGSASGFTLYMDTLRQVVNMGEKPRLLFIPSEESWTLVKNLQNEGWSVLRGFAMTEPPAQCTHIYKDGKIEEIK